MSPNVRDREARMSCRDAERLTFHTALYPVDELVGLAAVQQSPDGWKGVQDDGLRVGVNVVLKHTQELSY